LVARLNLNGLTRVEKQAVELEDASATIGVCLFAYLKTTDTIIDDEVKGHDAAVGQTMLDV